MAYLALIYALMFSFLVICIIPGWRLLHCIGLVALPLFTGTLCCCILMTNDLTDAHLHDFILAVCLSLLWVYISFEVIVAAFRR